MNDRTARRVRNRAMMPASRRSARPGEQGFSRPVPTQTDPERTAFPAEQRQRPKPLVRNRDRLLIELHELALDSDRARSYLGTPGCNVVLGQVQLSRTMAKRSRILQFLREGAPPADRLRIKDRRNARWST